MQFAIRLILSGCEFIRHGRFLRWDRGGGPAAFSSHGPKGRRPLSHWAGSGAWRFHPGTRAALAGNAAPGPSAHPPITGSGHRSIGEAAPPAGPSDWARTARPPTKLRAAP